MSAPISTDVEYLALVPGVSGGLGVGIITFRPVNQPGFQSVNMNLSRVSLERLRDDIEAILAESKVLNDKRTLADAEKHRVHVTQATLRELGVLDHQYIGVEDEDES